ncbi:MAG: Ig-like domain-containing protein [Bacteroidaceae bacterium]|nr:Ig-like domain-containing protein [Bacteroidaceae bacterium]
MSPIAETQWKSSNEVVATISADGTVTAIAVGTG